jgi:SAM-dependent methyltransferase
MTEKALNSYLNLCTQVYDLSKPTPPNDAYAFYRSYAVEAGGPILEPMCGTGRFLLPLVHEGFEVHGFDASAHMLDSLREKAKERGIKPIVWQGFIEELDRPERYRLAIIPSGSFGLITDPVNVMNVLIKLREHLCDDGLLVFEAENPPPESASTGIWRGSAWTRSDGKVIIANYLEMPLQENVSTTIWRYELLDGAEVIQTELEIIRVRQYPPVQMVSILEQAGFRNIKQVKAFDRGQRPEKTDEVIVYECRR